jgi:hypothetical protein
LFWVFVRNTYQLAIPSHIRSAPFQRRSKRPAVGVLRRQIPYEGNKIYQEIAWKMLPDDVNSEQVECGGCTSFVFDTGGGIGVTMTRQNHSISVLDDAHR